MNSRLFGSLLLLLSVILAGGLSWFQYYYRTGARGRNNAILAGLRFLSVFAILLLLINPVISRKSYETEKAILPRAGHCAPSGAPCRRPRGGKSIMWVCAQGRPAPPSAPAEEGLVVRSQHFHNNGLKEAGR